MAGRRNCIGLAGDPHAFGDAVPQSMNRKIIVAVVVITGSGVVNAILNKKALTPVIIGSYVFLFVLSVLDMYGGPMSSLAGAPAKLAGANNILPRRTPPKKIYVFFRDCGRAKEKKNKNFGK